MQSLDKPGRTGGEEAALGVVSARFRRAGVEETESLRGRSEAAPEKRLRAFRMSNEMSNESGELNDARIRP
jgi:hypothetical protein